MEKGVKYLRELTSCSESDLFATGLYQEDNFLEGILGFPLHAIIHKVKQAKQKQCCVCGERGAAITCAESGCEQSFHLPCAVDADCIIQFFGEHRSFCQEHCIQQTVQEAPEDGTKCVICLEPMKNSAAYHNLVCPVCKHTWFHRDCIQQQAMHTGTVCFRCPVCQDKHQFCSEMSTMGIQIPERRPTWMEDDTFPSLDLERHRRCDVSMCLYPGGREQAEREGPWQLLQCSSCATESTHRQCSYLSNTTTTWECNSCAGLASSSNNELAGPRTASQEGLEPSHLSSQEPENISCSPNSQADPGPSHNSQLPEHSNVMNEQRINCPHLCEDQNTSEQYQGHHGSRCTSNSESSSHTPNGHGTLGSSRVTPAATCRRRPRQRETDRTRSRSPLQRRSQSRPRRHHGSRQMPASGAQSSARSLARPATSRSSGGSAPELRRQSRQRGQTHTPSRSPVKCWASNSHSWP
ncbi:PHD finger protein 7-like [Cyrtonyx montezumae]|uniref:PHD finger protein 7-like n=1 Tax=Cyrtonyx montezumae TaxID=9017 RepID=UPI0032D9BBBF